MKKQNKQVWMTLSSDVPVAKRFFLKEILCSEENGKAVAASPRAIWSALAKNGIYLHPSLESNYLEHKFCFFCSSEILARVADEGNSEMICSECGYLYEE